ncbi:hypothetical protein EON64_13975 [archaeon]|nr:MAG: hypothetical protein EON64_13975 [archaeon]
MHTLFLHLERMIIDITLPLFPCRIRQDAPLPKTSQPSQGVKNSVHVRFTTSNVSALCILYC